MSGTVEHRCPKCRCWDVVSSTVEHVYSSGLSAGEHHRYWCLGCDWEVYEGENAYDEYQASEQGAERKRDALRAWDNATHATLDYSTVGSSMYTATLYELDATWRDADLPLPWYPSMIARGDLEARR